MLLLFIAIVGISVATLMVLYLLARWIPLLGDSLAFLCTLIARLLVKGEWFLEKAGNYCSRVFENSLKYPPFATDDCWLGIAVLSRLVYLFVAYCILFGEAYNTLLALPVLFQVPNEISLPGDVGIASSMLFLAVPAIFGAVVCECAGLIPHTAALFPRLEPRIKKLLGIICLVGFVLSTLVLLLFWIYRGLFLVDPDQAQILSIFIMGGLGLCVAGASVLALWAFIIGLVGAFSCIAWLIAFVCHAGAMVFSLLPSLLDVLAVHLSDGRIGVYHVILPGDPHKVPGPKFGGYQHPSVEREKEADHFSHSHIQEVVMAHPKKNASIFFIGSIGSLLFRLVSQKIVALRATQHFFTSAYLDLSLPNVSPRIPGIVDVTPTYAERHAVLLHEETETQAYQTLLSSLGGKLVETHLLTKAHPFPLLFVIDCQHLSAAVPLLQCVKRRLPLHPIVVLTSLSEQDQKLPSVQDALAELFALHTDGVIETVLVVDPHSPFALKHGAETQLHFLSQALVSLVVSHTHSSQNRSLGDLLKTLHRLSAFTTLSFVSEDVAVGTMPKRWAWLPGTKGQAGVGDFGDLVTQARRATDRVFDEKEARAWTGDTSDTPPCVVVYNTPISLQDSRFAAFLREMALYVGTRYPYSFSLTVRGNGCRYPQAIASRYLVQATGLYPVTLTTSHLEKEANGKSHFAVLQTQEPAGSNGHVPTEKATHQFHSTDAATSLASKPAPAPFKQRSRKKATK